MKKKLISELTILPVEKKLGGQKDMLRLADGTWLTTVGNGTAVDYDGNEWSEVPDKGYVKAAVADIDWSEYIGKQSKE